MGGDDHDHKPEPPADYEFPALSPENEGRTGYGTAQIGNLTNMWGGDVNNLLDYPEDITPLEKRQWFNHSLRNDYPPWITGSPSENNRIWQEMEIEQRLDHHPPYEVHSSELPDYHYWPPIQAEINHKPKNKVAKTSVMVSQHHQDPTDLPRFFRTGIPKTPLQEQDHFIPLTQEGRYNWRENIRRHGYTASFMSARGWDQRYYWPLNTPHLPMHISGARQWSQPAIHFRAQEVPFHVRIIRHVNASQFDRHMILLAVYWGAILFAANNAAHYREMNWNFEPWNYDITFAQSYRDKGGFHGII